MALMNPGLIIEQLDRSNEGHVSIISEWYSKEWNTPKSKTKRRLTADNQEDVLFQFVVLLDNHLVGTAGVGNSVNLTNEHNKFSSLKPWVTLFYLTEGFRNRGYGKILLETLEKYAAHFGLRRIYLYSTSAEAFFAKSGWQIFDRVKYKEMDTALMMKDLSYIKLN
jgi:GNAT superfamily N-acetyltransferase